MGTHIDTTVYTDRRKGRRGEREHGHEEEGPGCEAGEGVVGRASLVETLRG